MASSSYWSEVAQIIGSTSNVIKHLGNILAITANRMLHGTEDPTDEADNEPKPKGDVYTNTDLTRQWQPDELNKDFRGQTTTPIGFNTDHMRKGKGTCQKSSI